MGLWHPSALTRLGSQRLVTAVMLACTICLTSALDQTGVQETGRSQAKLSGGSAGSNQDTLLQQQPLKRSAVALPKRLAVAPNKDNEIHNNVNDIKSNNVNTYNNNVMEENQPNQSGGQRAAFNSFQQAGGDTDNKAVNPQALAQQQKDRLDESVRLNNELQNRLRIHEEERQKKEVQVKEREQQRQQRQQMLDDYRKAEQNARVPPRQSQREKEQKWLDDVEKKSVAKFKQQQGEQQQQQQQQMEQQPNGNLRLHKVAVKSENDAGDFSNKQLPKNAAVPHLLNNNMNVNRDNGGINNGLENAHSNRLARDPNSGAVKENADLDGNRILPVVKYPRDDGTINNNNNNLNHNFVDNSIHQDSVRRHDQPEANDRNPPVIRVDERQDLQRRDFDQNVNDNNNFNSNNNNNNDNNHDNNNFNNINHIPEDNEPRRNNDFQNGADSDPNFDAQLGGLHVNWDWDDFSIMFDNYGRAEMKVRRAPKPTTGEPWPMPQYYSKKEKKVYKISKDLRFIPTGVTCDVVEEAMTRHLQRILRGSVEDMYDNLQNAEGTSISDPSLRYERDEFIKAPLINRVELKVRKACTKYPSLESDESYDLVVKKKKTFIYANEVWGLLRGLETLGHLVWRGTDGMLYIKETVISDYPRFAHRGLHIDTSRHFLFKEVLFDIMDSMEMNKFNVFHWHIVDDQSFPYESKVFPELSRKGAFHPTYVYTLEDIAELIEYARMRGIRVLPEFDTPGHTYAWGLGRPELLTQCFSDKTPVKGYLGPLDPSKNSTYRFLHSLFQEIMGVFKDTHLHLGGDEVPLGCWQSNPEVMAFANELAVKSQGDQTVHSQQQQQQAQQLYYNSNTWNQWSDEIKQVYEYYENRLIKSLNEIARKRKKPVHYIMWQEVINNNLQLPNDTIIQVWMGDMADVMRATSMGYRVIYSTCWYLDHIEYGTKWPKYYQCDPVDQSYGYHIDEKKVLGGEAAFWSEYFSNENLIPLMWPRASAIAERLWSNKEVKNLDKAAERLSEHRCRMIKRGINAGEISGPGYCLHSPPKRRLFNETMGCKGANCSRSHNFVEIEDIQVHLSQRGGSLTDCGKLFHHGSSSVPILMAIILVLILALVAVTRSSSRLHRIRLCKNRFILLTFVVLLLIYFLCYTSVWMRAFEFSGSIHKTVQEEKSEKLNSGDSFKDQNFLPS